MDQSTSGEAIAVGGSRLRGDALAGFLNLGVVARLACLDAAGWPYTVPVWFEWDGAGFWVIGVKQAAWVHYLLENPHVALCIDEPETLRRVMCQGTATLYQELTGVVRWREIARRMAVRYLGDRAVTYEAATQHLERQLFYIQPTRLITWQGPGRYESQEG